MKQIHKIMIGQRTFLGEIAESIPGSCTIRRPVLCTATKEGTAMTKAFIDAEDEKITFWYGNTLTAIQPVSSNDPIHGKYMELTSVIHLAKTLPRERN